MSKLIYINPKDKTINFDIKNEKAEREVLDLVLKNLDNSLILFSHYWTNKHLDTTLSILEKESIDKYDNIFFWQTAEPIYFSNEQLKLLKNKFPDLIFIVPYNYNISKFFKTINFDLFIYFSQDYVLNHQKSIFDKKYCCFNMKPKHHRIKTLYELYTNNLLEEGYVTGWIKGKDIKSILTEDLKNKDFVSKFPFILDVETQKEVNTKLYSIPSYFYKTPINIVTETNANVKQLFITEKTLKATLAKQFTFLVGNSYTYSYLEKVYGFKNFDFLGTNTLFYEKAIKKYVYFLKKYTLDDIIDFRKTKLDILEHNFEVLMSSKKLCISKLEKDLTNLL